jgi:predicted exporter
VSLARSKLFQLALALALAIWCALRLEVGSDITRFMPVDSRSPLAALSARLADSELTRTLVLSVGGRESRLAARAAGELARELRSHPEVEWIRSGAGEEDLERLHRLYFPRRHAFLSLDPERELPALLSEEALARRARELRLLLAGPASPLLEQMARSDPIGAFERIAARFRRGSPRLRSLGGQLVTEDGHAVLFLATRSSAFASGAQGAFLADLEAAFETAARRVEAEAGSGAGLVLELGGAHPFAVAAERSIRRDFNAIATLSFAGVAAVFLLLVGTLRSFLVVAIPPLAGILVATSLGLWIFGRLDGLTMAFGTILMGVGIDYSVHLLIHDRLAPGPASPRATARRLGPSLSLGALTTMASFAGMAVTSFPAFREISVFSMAGVATAWLATRFLLPDWLPLAAPLPPRAPRAAASLAGLYAALALRRRAFAGVALAAGCLAALALPRLVWVDDLSKLTSFDPQLVEEDRHVRERVASFETGRVVVGLAQREEAALLLSEAIERRLASAVEAGHLEGTRSLADLLRSRELQRRNQDLIRRDAGLPARVAAAFGREGFREDAFEGFRAELLAPPPAALTRAELEAAGLGHLLAPLLLDLHGDLGVVAYLRGVRSPEGIRAALADLPGVHLFEQGAFASGIYAEFRATTLRQLAVGSALVVLLLLLRYRAWRPALTAFLPSLLVALLLLGLLALLGLPANLFHVMSLVMVMGMGVDYGIFLVDSMGRPEGHGATLLSLLVSCLTTAFALGALALSAEPSLRAIGVTAGVGIALSYLLAPLALAWLGAAPGRGPARAPGRA